jgi:hypothetical protein
MSRDTKARWEIRSGAEYRAVTALKISCVAVCTNCGVFDDVSDVRFVYFVDHCASLLTSVLSIPRETQPHFAPLSGRREEGRIGGLRFEAVTGL